MNGVRMKGQPWIPPFPLALGQLSHGLSWLLLLVLAVRGEIGATMQGLAWIHLVALGWLTMVALAILIFVVPNFTESPLAREGVARLALYPYAIGAYTMVAGFWTARTEAVGWGTAIVAAALVIYLVPMLASLGRAAVTAARAEAAIARAIAGVLVMLAGAAALGVAMAWALAGGVFPELLSRGPAVHAHLAGFGWLSILVFGVSMQTLGPIAGRRPRQRWRHIVVGVAALAGVLCASAGLALANAALTWLGAVLMAISVLLFLLDLFETLAGATNTHRPPQAFLAAGGVWLAVAVVLGLGVVAGRPWQSAYVYAGLVGWLGQMVNGHLHHIPIRLMATVLRGEEDETSPAEVLTPALSWLSWGLMQLAVGVGAAALVAGNAAWLAGAAACGLAGWCAMLANVASAYRRLRLPRRVVRLL